MYFSTILIGSFAASAGYFAGTRKFWISLLIFLISFCILFTVSVGLLFGVQVLSVLLQPNGG